MIKMNILLPIIGFLVTIALAVWKYLHELRQRERNERLERIGLQLKFLYGPLYSLINSRKKSWQLFESNHDVQEWDRKSQSIPEKDRQDWILWMTEEFRVTNEKIYQIIIENADLYIENGLPRAFETFITHFTEYRLIISRWKNSDESILFSSIAYPEIQITSYVNESFDKLKFNQFRLLGHKHDLFVENELITKSPSQKRFKAYGSE